MRTHTSMQKDQNPWDTGLSVKDMSIWSVWLEWLIDQHLKPDEGVTFDIFKEKEAEGEKEGEEAGEGEAQEAEKAEEKGEEEEPHLFV